MTVDRRALLTFGVRRTPVGAICAAGVVAGGVMVPIALAVEDPGELLVLARLAAIVVAASATSAVVDPCASLTDTTWRGRRPRLGVVLAATAVAVGVAWLVPAAIASSLVASPGIPVGGLLIELLALAIVGWVATAVFTSWQGPRGAPLVGATALVVVALATMTIARTIEWLWRSPGPGWIASHGRWSLIAVTGLLLLVVVWRDPS